MKEERNDLKVQLFIKRETEMENLENSQPIHIERNQKTYSRENKGVTKQHLTVSAHRPGPQSRGFSCSGPLYIAAELLAH